MSEQNAVTSDQYAAQLERDFAIMFEAMRWKNNRWVAARGIAIDVRGKKA